MARERVWTVEPDEYGTVDPEAIAGAMVKAGVLLELVGGVISVGAERVEVAPGMYETQRIVFRYSSYAPARRIAREAPQPEPAVEAEPELELPDEDDIAAALDAEEDAVVLEGAVTAE